VDFDRCAIGQFAMSVCPLDPGSAVSDFVIIVDEIVYEMGEGVVLRASGEGLSLFCARSIVCLGGRVLLVAVVGWGWGWGPHAAVVSACIPS
jgi:hypothetical protein